MTESEVRKLLRRMKELDSQTAFRAFYDMTYDRLYRIAYYYVKREEWSQEIVLDVQCWVKTIVRANLAYSLQHDNRLRSCANKRCDWCRA